MRQPRGYIGGEFPHPGGEFRGKVLFQLLNGPLPLCRRLLPFFRRFQLLLAPILLHPDPAAALGLGRAVHWPERTLNGRVEVHGIGKGHGKGPAFPIVQPQLPQEFRRIPVGIRDAGHQVAVNDGRVAIRPVLLDVQHVIGQQVHHGHAGEGNSMVVEQKRQQFLVDLLLGHPQFRDRIQFQQEVRNLRGQHIPFLRQERVL